MDNICVSVFEKHADEKEKHPNRVLWFLDASLAVLCIMKTKKFKCANVVIS